MRIFSNSSRSEPAAVQEIEPAEIIDAPAPMRRKDGPTKKVTKLTAGDEAKRKALRAQMMSDYQSENFESTRKIGRQLERDFWLDWEAEFRLAQAARQSGQPREAIERFNAFIEKYPNNAYVDDALFWAGRTHYDMGEHADALTYFKRVVALPKSDWRTRAEEKIDAIKAAK